VKRKITKKRNAFVEIEAEVSGPEGSEDECDESQAGYDESFVDDASQGGAAGQAMYLRSLRSPSGAAPARRLPPITADIFSQAPAGQEDSYLEDSFCVAGSQEEEEGGEDTLDLLERRAERPPAPRRRIAVRPLEDSVMVRPSLPQLLRPAPGEAGEEGRPSVVVSSAEVTRAAEVISLLKHQHGLVVVTRTKCEEVQYVVGIDSAVLRWASKVGASTL
jgi:hypothetical protein